MLCLFDGRPKHLFFFHSLLFLLLFLLSNFPSSTSACTQLEKESLVSFLTNVSSSPPLDWNTTQEDCCLWEGVSCNRNGSVTRLWLPQRGLTGSLSPSLGQLSKLSQLNLSCNSLSGALPSGLFSSSSFVSLKVLDLSFNVFFGEFPYMQLLNLQFLNLSSNSFSGTFPSLSLSSNLKDVNASNNSFFGSLPTSICANSTQVMVLDFSYNRFTGAIAPGLGECIGMEIFRAGFNNLSENIPDDLYQVVGLRLISLPFNRISGFLDGEKLTQMENLTVLELNDNELIGKLPQALGRLVNLEQLLLFNNNLTGKIPLSLTNCTKLKVLNLRGNSLVGVISTIDFSGLLQLSTLDLGNNHFTGNLPDTLYRCRSLTALRLAKNHMEGEIMPEMLALQSLSYLSLSTNKLRNITSTFRILMGFKNLKTVLLSNNFFGEEIPDDGAIGLYGFQSLRVLGLADCLLMGQIPAWLLSLNKLEVLDLSLNRLTGSIPGWLGTLPNLFYLDLSGNLLTGELPQEMTELPSLVSEKGAAEVDSSYLELPVFVRPRNASSLQYNHLSDLPPAIYLRNNSLSGAIPSEIGHLQALHVLDLSHNHFSGGIPDQLSNLSNLERLDLSWNSLSGFIPQSLNKLHFLALFSVANNSLQGPVPTGGQFDTFLGSSFEGNPGLCGMVLHRSCSKQAGESNHTPAPKYSNKKLLIGVILSICLGGGFILTVLTLWILSNTKINPGGAGNDKTDLEAISSHSNLGFHPDIIKDSTLVMLFPIDNELKELTISDIMNATNNFDQANIVGCGGFGLVYRATFASGSKLAIKKLNGDMGLMEREFEAEVEALSTAQHQNLVSLRGYCVHGSFRILVYSYMENGSLDYWLHERVDGASRLDWPTRLRITQGASRGLAYMHQICEPHIVHRDIKSSNILLDGDFEAHVADFGLSRLILPYNTHVTTEMVGTLGYIPPEYGQAWIATLRGDVYSFGVVMLELLTGRRPVDIFKPKTSRELVGWVQQMRFQGRQDQVFDPLLKGKGFEDQMLQVLDVACMCVNQNPFKRPTIKEIVGWLEKIGTDM